MKIVAIVMIASALALPATKAMSGQNGKSGIGPTEESALAADSTINQALLTNNVDALGRLLADEWIVINTAGGVGKREPFLAALKAGLFTRKTMDLSEPRVEIYGNTAVVTTHLNTSGMLGDKAFDVSERQTDVLVWKDGSWKSVLLHETKIPK
jgi:hypothetical protein